MTHTHTHSRIFVDDLPVVDDNSHLLSLGRLEVPNPAPGPNWGNGMENPNLKRMRTGGTPIGKPAYVSEVSHIA